MIHGTSTKAGERRGKQYTFFVTIKIGGMHNKIHEKNTEKTYEKISINLRENIDKTYEKISINPTRKYR